jgi:hypothetical protein
MMENDEVGYWGTGILGMLTTVIAVVSIATDDAFGIVMLALGIASWILHGTTLVLLEEHKWR